MTPSSQAERGAAATALPATSIDRAVEDGVPVYYLQGLWRLSQIPEAIAALRDAAPAQGPRCVLDGSRLDALDTAVAFVVLRRLAEVGYGAGAVRLRAMAERQTRLIALVNERMHAPAARPSPRRLGPVARIGAATLRVAAHLRAHAAFIGGLAVEVLSLVRAPRHFRYREATSQFESAALDAIPIASLVTFLIGVVFAYLLGVQAQHYGATIFVVDGVGLAICRELSPILVAVIVAGRSGAAFTAQIGSMKVQEETDAIRTLGLSPVQVLVVPRLVALIVGLPLLVFVGDVAGIAGGILVGAWQLEISPATFMTRLHAVLPLSAVVVGLGKAPVFGVFIATIACRMGMSVARDARSVGEHTTSTVVQSIVWVIVLDAVFAVGLQRLGI
jgi:phospholipid/cholesterol/gamma-HCH transport system permease protein